MKYLIYFIYFIVLHDSKFYKLIYEVSAATTTLEIENDDHNANVSKRKLKFVHIIYRHGDRTPVEPYPTDPWRNVSNWPVGWGQLTNIGKTQQFEFGQWLRKRYQNILSKTYIRDEIFIRSTDVDRTLMSALANLAGLYPPFENDVWNQNLSWQPIPIHTLPPEEDGILSADKLCPAYEYISKKFKQTDEYKTIDKEYADLYKKLSKYTGKTISSIIDVNKIHNCLFIESLYNKTLPDWAKALFYPGCQMEMAAAQSFALYTYTREMARLKAGFLLKEILNRCTNKSESTLFPNRVMWIYSAHDTTVANLLNTLNLFEYHLPPYTACILIELIEINDNQYIQIFYKNTTNEPKPLYIPNCGTLCPLNRMYTIYNDVLPDDWDTECHMSTLSMSYEDAELSSAMAFAIGIFSVMLAIVLIFVIINVWYRHEYSSSGWYTQIDD